MSKSIQYDDAQLQALFNQLSEQEQAKALRGAFRQNANRLRKAAVSSLRSKSTKSGPLHSSADLEKGVRAIVFKQKLGFRVTVGTQGRKKGFHLNRQGLLKPVLLWAEDGTKPRRTKSNGGKHTRTFTKRKRDAHATGRMPALLFMQDARFKTAGTITADMHKSIKDYVARTAQKHKCKV